MANPYGPGKTIVIDKGTSFKIQIHDRSYNGGYQDLLELDGKDLNLLSTGGYLVKGVPIGSGTPAAEACVQLTSDGRGDSFEDAAEMWGRDWLCQFDLLPPVLKCRFSGAILGNGTYKVRIGGSLGQPDGTVVATIVVTDGGDYPVAVEVEGPAFANPGGFTAVKLTGLTATGVTKIYATSIFIVTGN